ncbi:hypothetical protein BsWGS_08877 [Bradybaena similaris]
MKPKSTPGGQKDNSENEHKEPILPDAAVIKQCIYGHDTDRLRRCLQEVADPQKEEIHELLNLRDSTGKSSLDLIASLGRTDLASLVIQSGADVNSCTSKGYSCLHHAAAWGHLPILKILLDNGVNLHQLNIHGETARDVALRYLQQECADFLEIAEVKEKFQLEITHALKSVQEMDKALIGRITRDEKNRVINTCKGKQEWLNSTLDASAQDIQMQYSELTEIVQPILAALQEPLPEKT